MAAPDSRRRRRAEVSISDYLEMNLLFEYVRRNGSKIWDRKCCVDPNSLCDMRCSDFKIQIISHQQDVLAQCSCTKFEPPSRLETLKLHPLHEKEEG